MANKYKIIENALKPLDGSETGVDGAGKYFHGIPIMGKNPSGYYVPAEVDASGYQKVALASTTGDINVDNNSMGGNFYVGKAANGDFVTAYAAATQITLSGIPKELAAIYANDIVAIQQINASGAVVNTYTRDDVAIACAGTDPTTVTITGATFGATDTFVVYTNITRKSRVMDQGLFRYIGKASGSNADFTTAYASATTLTCSNLPSEVGAINADDIVAIVQIATAGSVTKIYYRDDVVITCTGTDPTTITVTGAAFINTDRFIVITNIPRRVENKGYDRTQGVLLVQDPNPFASGHISDPTVDVLLDDSPTSYTSEPIYFGDCDKVTFLLDSDVTVVGAAPQVTYTFEVSDLEETGYIPCDVVMTDDGEAAPVASVVHTADTQEMAYLPNGVTGSWLKVKATGANTDTDDTVACLVFTELKKG